MTGSPAEIIVDVHDLEPPEPFIEAMRAVDALQPGQYIHMIHRLRPRLLYPELAPRGLTSTTLQDETGMYHILVWAEGDKSAATAAAKMLKRLPGKQECEG